MYTFHDLLHLPRLEEHQSLFDRAHALVPPGGVRKPLGGALHIVEVSHLIGVIPDPFETLPPQPDDLGGRLEELMSKVSSFDLAFSHLGPFAQGPFHFLGGFDCLAGHLEKILLRLGDEDAWKTRHCLTLLDILLPWVKCGTTPHRAHQSQPLKQTSKEMDKTHSHSPDRNPDTNSTPASHPPAAP